MIKSGLRRAVAASAAQPGDGDWIINPIPSGTESETLLVALVHRNRAYWKGRTLFVWRVPRRQTKNPFSVSPVPLW